jgi:hypothetical protein
VVSEYATAYVKLRLGDGHGADAERDGVERAQQAPWWTARRKPASNTGAQAQSDAVCRYSAGEGDEA